jgi:MoaA/NifB/PqqE/SkfB family radical SAM enzyme
MVWPDFLSRVLPRAGWIQVQVTSCCHAACRYCPHTVYRDTWQSRHLPLATFQRLAPALPRKQLVYLQGWGEPFLHPDFFAMVALAKEAGCRVGTTTNGMLLDTRKTYALVKSGLDVIAFSLAGIKERNDAVRQGTSFAQVLSAIEALNRVKEAFGSATPAIHIAYMLLRSGLKDLEHLPRELKGLGLSQVVLSTLDFVPALDLEDEALPADAGEAAELRARLAELADLGRHYGLEISYRLPAGGRTPMCPEQVQTSLVVGVDGAVSPCVYTNLPVSRATYAAHGTHQVYLPLTFGNVREEGLDAIWRKPEYAGFRRSFYTGRLITPCQHCRKL